MSTKICVLCDEEKPTDQFGKGRNRCKVCDVARLVAWKEEHPLFGWYLKLKGRAKQKGLGLLTHQGFVAWFDDQEESNDDVKTCYYCGREMLRSSKMNGMTVDRFDPTIGYTPKNMILCCRRCNVIKGSWFFPDQMLEIADTYFKDEDKRL